MSSGFSSYIKNSRNLRILGSSASAMLATIMTLATFPIVNQIELAEATSGTASTTTLTMTSSHENLNLDLNVTSASGTFAESTVEQLATFDITTNNYTGYNLNIVALDDSGNLTNTTDGSTLSSIDTIMGKGDFDNTSNNGKWGYKPSKYNGVKNEAYIPSPTTDATMLDKTTSANATATADNTYSIGLGARVGYDTPYGTYSGSFRLVATANPVPYSISFADTSNDATVAGMPKTLTGSVDNTTVELPTNIPQRTGFTFAGWCDTTPTVGSDGSSTCPTGGTVYQPSTDATPTYIGIDQTAAMNATMLYAMWTAIPVTPTADVTVNFDGGISVVTFIAANHPDKVVSVSGNKATLDIGVSYTMTAYAPHGHEFKSWALNSSSYGTLSSTSANPATFTTNANSFSAVITVTSAVPCTTNTFPSGTTMQAFNPSSLCSTVASGTLTDSRDSATYTVAKINGNWWMTQNLRFTGTSINSSTTNINTTKTLSYGNLTSGNSNTEPRIHDSGDATTGVWYNYCAASAGTICTDSNTTEASYSLCPAGWRLPTHSEQQGITSYASAFSPVTGGLYSGGSLKSTGYGNWWSSTAYSGSSRYVLYSNGSSLNTDYDLRNNGLYVRCVKS